MLEIPPQHYSVWGVWENNGKTKENEFGKHWENNGKTKENELGKCWKINANFKMY